MLEFDFTEQDPIGNPPPSAQQNGRVAEAYPVCALPPFRDMTPYTYAAVGDQGALPQSGVALSAFHGGIPYDCIKMQTGLQNKCDTSFWMAPGRPQDQGTTRNSYESGVWKQQRMIGSNVSAAGSAPYAGIFTGLTGYIEMVSKE